MRFLKSTLRSRRVILKIKIIHNNAYKRLVGYNKTTYTNKEGFETDALA